MIFEFGLLCVYLQVEGAWNEGGRGPSIWDAFSHTEGILLVFFPKILYENIFNDKFWNLFFYAFVMLGKIFDKSNGDSAVDQYHRYKVGDTGVSYVWHMFLLVLPGLVIIMHKFSPFFWC